ncbi:act minimal PKS acyl carrier protein [Spinactinospora alkalitolerans]|uniref:Act minimal PKS acyl carrier protein n=1 Tax=Spinactinospora alkalitolerans TaxID=687207 RepID=A0A852TPK2_9ACTN|nr:acyl carrier protein [Spinactinospora alkalitolerans]NYE45401.1 act minimal PKS acyl carrier protein [Spinactinospora alkalitolerans]
MSGFTIDDLRSIMATAVEVDEDVDLNGDIAGTAFDDLGYDSLAVMEVAAHVQRATGVRITDEAAGDLPTPGDMVAYVTNRLTAAEA